MAKTLEVGPYYCLPSARERERERRGGRGREQNIFQMQTLECKEDGNNERVVDDRSRETVLCAAAAAALGRASERASGSSSSGA